MLKKNLNSLVIKSRQNIQKFELTEDYQSLLEAKLAIKNLLIKVKHARNYQMNKKQNVV